MSERTDKQLVAFEAPAALVVKLDELADRRMVSRSALLRTAAAREIAESNREAPNAA